MHKLLAAGLLSITALRQDYAPQLKELDLEVVVDALTNRVMYAPPRAQFDLPVPECALLRPEQAAPSLYRLHDIRVIRLETYDVDMAIFRPTTDLAPLSTYWVMMTNGKQWGVGYTLPDNTSFMIINSQSKGWDKMMLLDNMRWEDVPKWIFDTTCNPEPKECPPTSFK